jgi:hypothetical protein
MQSCLKKSEGSAFKGSPTVVNLKKMCKIPDSRGLCESISTPKDAQNTEKLVCWSQQKTVASAFWESFTVVSFLSMRGNMLYIHFPGFGSALQKKIFLHQNGAQNIVKNTLMESLMDVLFRITALPENIRLGTKWLKVSSLFTKGN